MALEALRKATEKKSGGGNFTPGLDPLVEFVSAEVTGDPAKDFFVIRHLNNCPEIGKMAGDTDKFRLSELKQTAEPADKNKRGRPTLADHLGGKNRVKKALPGSVYVLENAWRDRKDGMLVARWTNQVAPAVQDPTGKVTPITSAMVKVFALSADKTGAIKGSANALTPNTERAVRVHGPKAGAGDEAALSYEDLCNLEVVDAHIGKPKSAALADAVRAALTKVEGGTPGFILRAVNVNDPTEAPVAIATCDLRNVGVEAPDPANPARKVMTYVTPTPDEAAAAFLKDNEELLGNLDALPQEVMVELVPYSAFPVVGATKENLVAQIEASKAKDPNARYHRDRDSEPFYGPIADAEGKTSMKACWAESNLVLQLADKEPGKENEDPFYFRTFTKPRSRQPQLFADAELVTPNLSGELIAAFTAAATHRAESKSKDRKPDAAPAAEDTNTMGDDPALENEAAAAMSM